MEDTLEQINKACLKFLAPLSLESTYENIVKEATKLVDAQYGSLFLEENGELQRVYSTLPKLSHVRIRSNGSTYQAFKSKQAFATYDFGDYHPAISSLGVKSNIFIPLAYKGQSIGVLIANSCDEKKFTKRELHILKLFGSLISLAIIKVKLHQQMDEALRARNQLISMLAHELRTPLTTISGYVQMLKTKFQNHQSNEYRWISETVQQTYRLSKLVNQMLDISRIKSGQAHFIWEQADLMTVVNQAVAEFNQLHQNHQVAINKDSGGGKLQIICDIEKLQQAILNLLDNAAKFSPHNPNITISTKSHNHIINVYIQDSGQGMSQKDLSRVFEEFYKGTNFSHENSGIGMGLYLSRHVIEQHHGSLTLRSKLRKGTTAIIKLRGIKI